MTPKPIKCDAKFADGSQCQQVAVVSGIQYKYERIPEPDGSNNFILQEVQYNAMCPKCGERKIVEKSEFNE